MKTIKAIIVGFLLTGAALIGGCTSEYDPSSHTGFSRISSPETSAEVTMFFWYRCPACYQAERIITPWAEKNNVTVEFRHSAIWEDDARLFYTLDLMGKAQSNQPELMEYFRHASKATLEDIAGIVGDDITADQIRKRLSNHHVQSRINGTRMYETSVGSTGVPLIVVGNRFALINEGMSPTHMETTLDYLIKEIRSSQ